MKPKLPRGTLDKLWNDPANWRATYFYYCKDDPRHVVPKRNTWAGWTINFAHPAAWARLLLGMSVTFAIAYAALCTRQPLILTTVLVVIIVLSIVIGRRQSSPDRFEEHE